MTAPGGENRRVMLDVACLHQEEIIGGSYLRWLDCTRRREYESRRREYEGHAGGGLTAPGGYIRGSCLMWLDCTRRREIGGSCLRWLDCTRR